MPSNPQADGSVVTLARRRLKEIAALPSRWVLRAPPQHLHLQPSSVAAKTIELSGVATVTAAVTTHVSLLGALAIGGAALGSTGVTALAAGLSALSAKRTPEQNAVSYLLNARGL